MSMPRVEKVNGGIYQASRNQINCLYISLEVVTQKSFSFLLFYCKCYISTKCMYSRLLSYMNVFRQTGARSITSSTVVDHENYTSFTVIKEGLNINFMRCVFLWFDMNFIS